MVRNFESIIYFIVARVQMNQIQEDCNVLITQTQSWRCLLAWRIRLTIWIVTKFLIYFCIILINSITHSVSCSCMRGKPL